MSSSLRLLHTSDWHLGHSLMSRDRRREHGRFLDWLLDCLRQHEIDVLLVCGDVFDSAAPPNYALRLFYDFLYRIPSTPCRKVVVIGGNHDSIATLHAPRNLLQLLQVHVVGGPGTGPEEELVPILAKNGETAAIIAAVPFLRDRDLRLSVAGENHEEKSRALLTGMAAHYQGVMAAAERLRASSAPAGRMLPIIATGHLFVAGGVASEGVRELFVGTLGDMPASVFPAGFDYIALGHLHRAQSIDARIHYSGSPIPLSFGEVGWQKVVKVVTFSPGELRPWVEDLPVPCFQRLAVARGNLAEIRQSLTTLAATGPVDGRIWVEVQVSGASAAIDPQEEVAAAAAELPLDILAVRRIREAALQSFGSAAIGERLDDLTPEDVLGRRLAMEVELSAEEREELLRAFREALLLLAEEEP
ncbi:MAG: exonuclease SbcCD subunit D C-terminal domain-containing protein [Thermodesulfobacteriota bacterium]